MPTVYLSAMDHLINKAFDDHGLTLDDTDQLFLLFLKALDVLPNIDDTDNAYGSTRVWDFIIDPASDYVIEAVQAHMLACLDQVSTSCT